MAYFTTAFQSRPSGTFTVVTVGRRADFSATKSSRPRASSPIKENKGDKGHMSYTRDEREREGGQTGHVSHMTAKLGG